MLRVISAAALLAAADLACSRAPQVPLSLPRGYVDTLQVDKDGKRFEFGPFVGYYFRPETPGDLSHLHFLCFNEQQFYTDELPANTRLYEGIALQRTLPEVGRALPDRSRINPVFFHDAPVRWKDSRPVPQDAFLHFHSCYDAAGPALTGYWLAHTAVTSFTYNMGGRVGRRSPLFHRVHAGVDTNFAPIIEFDRGPGR